MPVEDRLSSGIDRLGLCVSESQLSKLRNYARMVLEFNKGYNLMKADGEDEMYVNHILDSLSALRHIQDLAGRLSSEQPALADIGSGGGCPGIPLAILMESYSFTLVERMEKRSAFLSAVVRELALQNVRIQTLQAEKVVPGSFDLALFRAFHPFDRKTTKTLLSLLKKGGFLAAYKARSEKIAAEMDAVRDMIPSYQKIPLTVPFLEDHERNLVVVQKC